MIKIYALERLVSQLSNQEKISHYTKQMAWIKMKLARLSRTTAPITYKKYETQIKRLTLYIQRLKKRHKA